MTGRRGAEWGGWVCLLAVAVGCGDGGENNAPSATGAVHPALLETPPDSAPAVSKPKPSLPLKPRGPFRGYLDWDMHESAAAALGRIGAAAVPQLLTALADQDPIIRQRAADVLARIGPEAQEATPRLIELLRDEQEDDRVRKTAAWALGQIGPAAAGAVPALMELLRQPQADAEQASHYFRR
jgi:hypothetical protein